MFKWLRRSPAPSLAQPADPSPDRLHDRLEQLVNRANHAPEHARGALFARAGDLCIESGEPDAAKSYYGRAIDVYLETRRFEEAAATCRRLIEVAPDVVRAYFTLLVLAIRESRIEEIEERIEAYVRVSKQSRTQNFAIARLWLVAEAVPDPRALRVLGRGLVELGDTRSGEELLAVASRLDKSLPAQWRAVRIEIHEARWGELLRVATADPVAVWARHWMGLETGGPMFMHPNLRRAREEAQQEAGD